MVCEGVLNLFGTSSKEIEEHTRERIKQEYLLEIRRLTEENQALTDKIKALIAENKALIAENKALIAENQALIAENKRLKQLLIQHNIPF